MPWILLHPKKQKALSHCNGQGFNSFFVSLLREEGSINFFSDVYYMVLSSEYSQSGRSQANSFCKLNVLKLSEYSMLKQLIAAHEMARSSSSIIIDMRFPVRFDISTAGK